ncbi:UNKNOWN [Stylonychia lemnae]|uniref:Uncharacterized protein n=1 Tax=Stylonychia lemnae TaxID=5949 RepID=A0A078AHR4_STYLE|nr:UNKNOWN [Stylonychia lemnae]|eukprot:CDW81815.1 UNKNOWN [Stylonychia lemnae]
MKNELLLFRTRFTLRLVSIAPEEAGNYSRDRRTILQIGILEIIIGRMMPEDHWLPKKQPNIFIETQHKLEDIECCDFVPQDRQVRYNFKYYCPVCLRYFNHILVSQCCFNYMCHFCADEQLERERNIDKFIAKCPYNCEGKFELKDVTPNMQVKRYSDSQFMSFYSNNLGKNTAGGFGKFGKENMSPQIVKNLTSENFNNNKTKNAFINSANGFMRPYQDQNSLQLQDDEESKRQMMMHRSDAMQYVQRPPLNQIRANIIRQANQGFVMQSNTMTINNGGDDVFSQPPVDHYYEQDNYQFQSPQSRQNFNQNIDGISAIDLPGGQGIQTYNSSAGFQGFNEYTDYNIQSQGFEVQGPQFINVENNFSPQQQISQDRDDLSSIEEDDDDLDREHH